MEAQEQLIEAKMIEEMMTCKSDVGRFLKVAETPKNILWSFKLDGVRVKAVVNEDDTVKYYSRTQKEYFNFKCFDKTLIELAKITVPLMGLSYPVEFDGEVKTKTGDFSKVMTQLRRLKDVDSSLFEFNIFDMICPMTLKNRLYYLHDAFQKLNGLGENLRFLQHYPSEKYFNSVETVTELMLKAVTLGYEGIVLKTANGAYEHKRSSLWCKVKKEETADVKIVGYEMGKGKHTGMLGALLCELKDGIKVRVGGGFSDEERKEFLADIENMMGKLIEVKYQEKTNTGSLRFPVFKRIRDDKLEVST